jgi:D-beta-D-heptose 7-phosphate kinase/D-beta-D-heptose 1-phosphate adenosyltransferase
MDKVSEIIDRFIRADLAKTCTVSVVGDVMIDEYYDVSVDRVSPEFPIKIMKSRHDRCSRVPGGAANVAMQFTKFNTRVYLTGITSQIMPLMPQRFVKEHSPVDCGLPIPIKKRFYQGDFPVARWDVEEKFYGMGADHIGWKFDDFELKESDVTVFSDYDKGLFHSGWQKKFLSDRISIVDPKGDLSRWYGCTVLKPNSVEAKQLTGEDDWKRQADKLRTIVGCRDVVITQGDKGVCGLTPEGYFEYQPPHKVGANSVIGAGDCFIAFLAMAIAHGMTTAEASTVAFEAGAIYVQRKHNRPLKPAELLSKRSGEQIVFTNGCFDILHAGHISTLEFAKNQGDILVVGVNSDESIRRLKGEKRPVNKLEDRMKVLSAMKYVDCVIPFDADTPLELIKYVRPDIVVKGGDYKPEDVVGNELAEVIIAPVVSGLSTTGLISKLT